MNQPDDVAENVNHHSAELLAERIPYNKAHEISRSRIKYDSKTPLGMGQFGIVFKGTLALGNTDERKNDYGTLKTEKSLPVAIKTVKPGTGVEYLRSLLKEIKVMLVIGKHVNIVGMIGSCTENLSKGEVLVLVEYCANGSMESYLLKNRESFINIVKKGKIDLQNNQNTRRALDDTQFDFFALLKWCAEVARGMEFLSINKVIHSDLAARNVLLTENLTCKISDFGLSRQLYAYSQYVKKNQEPLPWRWLALESLKNMEFSTKSDVWSYGVLCWEIFTLGEKPYPTMCWSAAFIANLEEGMRLEKPKFTTLECYNFMLHCWDEDVTSRPTFTEIIEDLQDIEATAKEAWTSSA